MEMYRIKLKNNEIHEFELVENKWIDGLAGVIDGEIYSFDEMIFMFDTTCPDCDGNNLRSEGLTISCLDCGCSFYFDEDVEYVEYINI